MMNPNQQQQGQYAPYAPNYGYQPADGQQAMGYPPAPAGAYQAPYPQPGAPQPGYWQGSPYPPAAPGYAPAPQMYAPNQPYGAGGYGPVVVQPGVPGQPPPQMMGGQPMAVMVVPRPLPVMGPPEHLGSLHNIAASLADIRIVSDEEIDRATPSRQQQQRRRTKFVLRYLEEKVFELGRQLHVSQGRASIRRGWMPIPQGIPNCPPGLEYLTAIDQLLVHQKVELLEAFTGFETANKYTVKNTLGQKVYWAAEDTGCCNRMCCGAARAFDMKVLDTYQNEVLHFNRPLRCSSCWFPCCLQTMEVTAPPGNVIGYVEQDWSILTPQFSIKDQNGETVLKISGPFCTFSICGDVEFEVLSTNGTQVGKISKQWSGLGRELFTDADHFGINFPMDLDVRVKATLLGALFLIDYMFFEKSGNKEQDRPGMF
ncbi:phospholipid scramblase 2-like isoform X6 [Anopheles darlingi]|uniref:phospholipid scramblase 2-like isoform X6 n=1 Tax=Anopheles darlingi TaxID=43151 RepID=UPI0021003423|nr:phospholipid scramblase 2-like isoform X6 [Anopheles darlingi]